MCSLLIAPAKCNLITAPGPAPQVPLRQGSGVGGTGEDVGGGVGDRGDREKKGREERKTATEQGWSHRSRTVREVELEGQEKMWEVVWGDREVREKRKRGKEDCDGAGPVPLVPHRPRSGLGGTADR